MTKPKRFHEIPDHPTGLSERPCGCDGCRAEVGAEWRDWAWADTEADYASDSFYDLVYLRRCLLLMMGYGGKR